MFNGTNANLTDFNNVTNTLNNQTYVNGTLMASGGSVNSTVTNINQTMQSQQIQVATQNIIHSVGKSLGKLTNGISSKWDYWWNGAAPKVSVQTKQKIAAAKADQKRLNLPKQHTRFESSIYSTINDIFDERKTFDQGIDAIVKHLNSKSRDSHEDFEWTIEVLRENFPEQSKTIENSIRHKQINLALEQLSKNWLESTVSEAVGKIVSYLESDASGDPVEAFDSMIITLRKSFDENKSQSLESAIIDKLNERGTNNPKQKREVREGQVYTLSPKVALNAAWDRLSLCAHNLRAVLFGASTTSQEAKVLDIQANVIQFNDPVSAAITSQLPARWGKNYMASACGDNGVFHLSTANDQDEVNPPFKHAAIQGDTLAVPQHPSSFDSTDLPSKAARPAHLGGFESAFPYAASNPRPNSTYLPAYATNSSGDFLGDYPFGASEYFSLVDSKVGTRRGDRIYQEIFSFVNGLVKSLVRMTDGIQELSFDGTLSLTGQVNTSNLSPAIFNQIDEIPIATRTPLADDTLSTVLISQLTDGSTALYNYDLSTKTFTSAKVLSDGSRASVANADLNIAHCPESPGTYVYVREVSGAFKYDVVNASMGGASLIGGEQEYTDYNSSNRPQPGVGCFSNNDIIFSFLDNGKPSYVTLKINPPPGAPTISAPSTSGVEIVVNIPPNLGDTPVPIDGTGIVVSNGTVIITITDKNGFKIVFTNNGTDVPVGEFYPVKVFQDGTFSWGRGTAVEGTVPQLTGCNAEDQCTTSTPGTPLQALFNSGSDWRLILGIAMGVVGAVGIVGTTIYCKVVKPDQDRKKARYEEAKNAMKNESIDLEPSSSSSSGEQSKPMWTSGNPNYTENSSSV